MRSCSLTVGGLRRTASVCIAVLWAGLGTVRAEPASPDALIDAVGAVERFDAEQRAAAVRWILQEESRVETELDGVNASIATLQTKLDALRDRRVALLSPGDAPESVKKESKPEMVVTTADREFWSFLPFSNDAPPEVNDDWGRTPIDRFILANLKAKQLSPNDAASRRTLIRRAYFDVIGLPPSPDAVEAFVNDPDDRAYERLVDELLASPHYGERWGRHWLDLARYADSDGYEMDVERPQAYPYRDAVIQALNEDMPFDQFVRWQIAGDELAPDDPLALALTGFCTAGPRITNQQTEQNRYDELDDVLSTTVSAVLGLTIGCARCHDHKYDPIPARDYYRMLAAFTGSKPEVLPIGTREEIKAHNTALAEYRKAVQPPQAELTAFLEPFNEKGRIHIINNLPISDGEKALLLQPADPENIAQVQLLRRFYEELQIKDDALRAVMTDEEQATWKALADKVAEVNRTKPSGLPLALRLVENGVEPAESFYLDRGDPSQKVETVELGFLQALAPEVRLVSFTPPARPSDIGSSFQRATLAAWMTDPEHGAGHLAARVIVNRLWQHHFGEGLVRTPSDFGFQGDRPVHEELIDWLAGELIRQGWRLKPMHRLIMLSAVYQQSVDYDDARAAVDPQNRLWWRRRPMRVESEILRDTMLAVSGKLNREMGGPGVKPRIHPDAVATGSTKKWPANVIDGPATWRRSVYILVKRSVLIPLLDVFDGPNATASCAQRATTTVAPQALQLMNDVFSREQAGHFASRVLRESGPEIDRIIGRAYELALSRAPTAEELNASTVFMREQAGRYRRTRESIGAKVVADVPTLDEHDKQALVDLCQVLFNLNEFVYID